MQLLQSNAAQGQLIPQGVMGGGDDLEDQQSGEDEQSEGGLTINADEIEAGIKKEMDKKQVANLDKLLSAGNELLFSKETHYQMIDGLKDSQDIGGALGKGAFDMCLLLLQQSGNTMPSEIILPGMIILTARVCEFIDQSGMAEVDDDDFEEAVHVFTTLIMDKFNPEFKKRMHDSMRSGQQQDQIPQDRQQMMQSQQSQPMQQGLLGSMSQGV